ncbi:hypothetical protein GW755_00580 [bacterium]|nr:hypothetical protein [bacterium]
MSRVLHRFYYKKYIFILSSIAFITVIFGLFSYYNQNKNYTDINVIDLIEEEEQSNLDKKPSKGTEEGDSKLNFTIKGKVTGITNNLDRPSVKVRISTKNLTGEIVQRVLGLDYDNSFLFEAGEISRNEEVVILLESPDYIFYPSRKAVLTDRSVESLEFKATVKELSSDNLNLTGKISAPGNLTGIVYLIGWDAADNSRIKKFTSINSAGEFKFLDLQSGTYLILPEIKDYRFFPESKQVELVNKDTRINFIGTKSLF